MGGTIWLIVEDDTDAEVVKAILSAKGVAVSVNHRTPSSKTPGISQLAKEIDKLINDVISAKHSNDCIAVLHDADEQSEPERRLYEKIRVVCERFRKHVVHVIATDEIEAWLLADEGLCQWLGIKARNCDMQRRPSDELKRLVQQKKQPLKYQGPGRDKVLAHLDGSGDKYSPSMREALEHLQDAPCVKQR